MLKQTMWKVLPAFTLFLAACGVPDEPSIDKLIEIPIEAEVSLKDQSVTVDEDTTVEITVKATVEPADAGEIALTIDKAPAHGTLTGEAGSYTYTPDPDFNGEDEATLTAKVGDKSATATIKITVTPVNDAPYFTAGADVNADEDAGAQAIVWATGIAAGPLDEVEAVTFSVANDNAALFLVQPFIDESGTLHFTSVTDASGVANVTVSISDGALSSANETFVLTINPVNDTPSFTAGAAQPVLEDSGVKTVVGWATALSAGPADEAGQGLVFIVSNDNNSLFSTQPTVATNGTLSFTPAANAFGVATVSVAIKDNGDGTNTSAAQNFSITITNVNDIPTYTPGSATVVVAEDSGPYAVAWASNVSAGPNESAQVLTFSLTMNSAAQARFASQPTMSSTGVLYFVPAADAFGTSTVRVVLSDDGGTANGGVNAAVERYFDIQITSVNDAPSMVTGGTITVNEDAPAFVNPTWATNMRVGPANEVTGQTLSVSTSNDNNALFSVQPALTLGGQLSFTLAPNASGTATVTFTLGDAAPTGALTADYSTVIEVLPVNDAPTFTVSPAVINLTEDQGNGSTMVQTNLIVSPSAGPADEASQTLWYSVTVTGTNVFALAPTIQTTNLVFSLGENLAGTAYVTITAHDNGGTANGGVDTSAPKMVTVNVSTVNDPPIVANDVTDVTINHPIDIDVLANDSDVDSPLLTISAVDDTGTSGTVTRINGNTAIRFVPDNGFQGTTTFTYTASDGSLASVGTVTVNVTADTEGPVLIASSVNDGELLNASALNSGGALNPAVFEFGDYNFDENSPTVTASLAGIPLVEFTHFVVDRSIVRTTRVIFFNLDSVKAFAPDGEAITISLDNIEDDFSNPGESVQVTVVLDKTAPDVFWSELGHDSYMRAIAFFSESMEASSFDTFVFEKKNSGIDVAPYNALAQGTGILSRNTPNDGYYFVPAEPLEVGKEYVLDISNFTDPAGNKVNSVPHEFTACCAANDIKVVRFELIDSTDAVVYTVSPAAITNDAFVLPASFEGQTYDLRAVLDRELSTSWNGSYVRVESVMDGEGFAANFESVDSGVNNALRFGNDSLDWSAVNDYRIEFFANGATEGSISRRFTIAVKKADDGHDPYVTVVNGYATIFGKPQVRAAEPLLVAFSEKLDPNLVSSANFEIENAGGYRYPVVLEETSETGAVWLRASDENGVPTILPYGQYTLHVNNLADLSTPARIGSAQQFPFSVIGPFDGSPFVVESSNPAHLATNVPSRPIDVYFTKAVDAYSLLGNAGDPYSRGYLVAEQIAGEYIPHLGIQPSDVSLMPQQRIMLRARNSSLRSNSNYVLAIANAFDINGFPLNDWSFIEFSTGGTTSVAPVIHDVDVRLDLFGATFTVGGDANVDSIEIGISFADSDTSETYSYSLSNLSLGGYLSEAAMPGFHDTTVPDIDQFFAEGAYSTLIHAVEDNFARSDSMRQQVYRLSDSTLGAPVNVNPVVGKPGVYTFSGSIIGPDAAVVKGVEIYIVVLNTVTNDLQGLAYQAPATILWEEGTQQLDYTLTLPEQAALPQLTAPLAYVAIANFRVPQKLVLRPQDSSGITLESATFNP